MQTLLDRFCRYVRIDTTANDSAGTYPSSPGQLELGRLLTDELLAMGISDAVQNPHGIVYGTVPGNVAESVPTIAWIAHVDTSPETTGKNVQPVVHRSYQGNDILYAGDPSKILRTADNPDLLKCIGKTIITTDGTTLLGADDKAGVAVIMEAVQYLMKHPEIPHGPIRVCFTCDEEIGHGVDHVDLKVLGALVGYTLDGGGTSEIDVETFSADLATVTIQGINIHPALAKGRMVNAVRIASAFVDRMPVLGSSPESTEGRDGFLHPYRIDGGVAGVSLKILLRDFETAKLTEKARLLESIAETLRAEHPGATIEVKITPQYRNMAEGLSKEPRAALYAQEAMRRAGLEPRFTIVRGGTDGSRLTEIGLPTPNLSCGEHNLHSPLEWTCLEEMDIAVQVLVELAKVWAGR